MMLFSFDFYVRFIYDNEFALNVAMLFKCILMNIFLIKYMSSWSINIFLPSVCKLEANLVNLNFIILC